MAKTTLTVYEAIIEVMKRTKPPKESGYNKFHKYHYPKEKDILDVCRPHMLDIGLVVLPVGIKDKETITVETSRGNNRMINRATVVYKVVGPGGDSIDVEIDAAGADEEDKGPYKLMTGAEKYVLLKLLKLASGDDPENDGGESEEPDDKPARRGRSARRPGKPKAEEPNPDNDKDDESSTDKPARRSRRGKAEEPEETESKPRRSRSRKPAEDDEHAEEKPARGRRERKGVNDRDKDDEQEASGRRGRKSAKDTDDDDKPASRRGSRRKPADDPDEDNPFVKPKRAGKESDDDDDGTDNPFGTYDDGTIITVEDVKIDIDEIEEPDELVEYFNGLKAAANPAQRVQIRTKLMPLMQKRMEELDSD